MNRQSISSGGPYEAKYGYSRAVRVGDQIHVSGTCAQPPSVEGVDAYRQAVDALRIIGEELDDAGSSLLDVVRTRIYVIDIGDADAVLRAHGQAFGGVRPAATLVQVAALIDLLLRVEIEAYAIAAESTTV